MSSTPAEYCPPAETILPDQIKEEPLDCDTDPFELSQMEDVKMDLMEPIGEVSPDPIDHHLINSVDVDGSHHPRTQTEYENNPNSTRCRFCFNQFHEVGGRVPISLKRVIFVLGLPKGKLLEQNPECCLFCKEMFDQSFEFKRLCLAALARSMDCPDWIAKEDAHDNVETQSSSSEYSMLEESGEESIVSEDAIVSTEPVPTFSTPPMEGSQLDKNASKVDCQMCNEKFFEWSDLEQHRLTHFSASTEHIHVTNSITPKTNDQQRQSQKTVELYCYRCTKWYPSKLIYEEHKEKCVAVFEEGKQTQNIEYYCFRCSKWFSSKDVFTSHRVLCKTASDGGEVLEEPELSEANVLPASNESPTGQPGTNGFFCTRCRMWYQSKLIFTNHVPLCKKATGKELENLRSNLSLSTTQPESNGILRAKRKGISAKTEPVVVTPVVQEHQCNRCKQIFTTKQLYRDHRKLCLQEKLYSCQQCPSKFNIEAKLIIHTNHHNGVRNYPCREGCGKMLLSTTTRFHHEKRCGKEIRVLCSICGAVFRSDNAMHVHMASHGNPLFSCKLCDKSFHTKSRLKKHGGVHTDARNFECKVCGKRFKSREANRVHQRIHTQEKPYVCSICGTAFTYNCLLKAHMEKGHELTDGQRKKQASKKSQSLVYSDGEPKD